MTNNPLTNVYVRLRKKISTTCPLPAKKRKYRKTKLMSQIYQTNRKIRQASSDQVTIDIQKQGGLVERETIVYMGLSHK